MLALDAVLLVVAVPLSVALHRQLRLLLPLVRDPPPNLDQLAVLPLVIVPALVACSAALGLHRIFETRWSRIDLLWGLAKLHVAGFAFITVLLFSTQTVLNRSLTVLYLGCSFLLLLAARSLLGRWARFQYATGQGRQRILIVGAPKEELRRFVERARAVPLPPHIVGILAPEHDSTDQDWSPQILGAPEKLDHVLHTEAVDQVLFFPPWNRPTEVAALVAHCETLGIPASFLLELPRPASAEPRLISQMEVPFVSFDVAPKPPGQLAFKHFLDVAVAALLLFVLAPVLACAALGILVTMGRPIFFVQERAGLFGRRFRMLKFRTMRVGAEQERGQLLSQNEMDGPVFKMSRDPRITPLGRFLRRTSIDELPQLIHVLTGTMSLVGPRPLPVQEQSSMRGWHRRRLSMKPGLTGLWQVNGRSDVEFERWMKLDLDYVDRWSLGLDLEVLLKTVPTVISGRGAR